MAHDRSNDDSGEQREARGLKAMTRVAGHGAMQFLTHRRLRVQVILGQDAGLDVVGERPLLHVGTQDSNSVVLTDPEVSRIHLELSGAREGIRVVDMCSTNGTYLLDGVRITEAYVPPGTVLRAARTQLRVMAADTELVEPMSPQAGFGLLSGKSAAMRALFALLARISPTDETVLITGETGTGKELCAHSIVGASRRAGAPLVIVDCGGIPHNLLESELFGHVRGAFTGADRDYAGAFERAQGGTVFLDELGELPLELQTRLLRVVESRTLRRIGSGQVVPLDVRILAATNRRLEEEINSGRFRADLFYRLSVMQVRLPPLRERPEDLEPLSRELLREVDADPDTMLTPEVLARLRQHRWPGNVRELRNELRRMCVSPLDALPAFGGAATVRGASGSLSTVGALTFASGGTMLPYREAKELSVAHFERQYLEQIIAAAGGNISQAARLAHTDRAYMSRLLSKHGIRTR